MKTIAGWNYEQPTEQALLARFGKSLGPDAADVIWAAACRRLAVNRPVTDLDDLIRVSEAMIELGDLIRVAGRGSKIRLVTYRALEADV